jgi:leader peptidase (prepilin peptidase)/N-methyltransferase
MLGWTLLTLAWIDMRHLLLPDPITLPLVVAGLLVTWWFEPDQIIDHALGAVVGYLFFRAVAVGYRVLRGREGLGAGDAKLLAVAGAWVGWAALPAVVLAAALLGIAIAAMGTLRGGSLHAGMTLPFGPALALAFWIVRLMG